MLDFRDSFIKSTKGFGRRFLAFLFSFSIIGIAIIAMIVVPLMSTIEMPTIEVYSAFLAPPPPPP
ncbi:hypothetical protein KJ684_03020, partial [Patescibacteria group bacterium]|nr:hypothetical protein [Patescibacteria group bacterium]